MAGSITGEHLKSVKRLFHLCGILAHQDGFATSVFTSFRWRTNESNDEIPYSHHGYAYALSNPVLYTDPTGKCALWFDIDCEFDLHIPTWQTICVSSWVPLIGQADCKSIGNVDDFRETIVDPIVGVVKPTYDVVSNQTGARETARRGLEYAGQHPIELVIVVAQGFVTPFVNIYQGLTCRDSKQLAHGLIGFEFLLGAVRLTRTAQSAPKSSDAQLLLATNPRASPPLGHNVVGVRLPGAPKPTFFEQVMAEAGRSAVKDFLTAVRGGTATRVMLNSGRKLGNGFNIRRIALSEEQAQAAYAAAQRMRGPSGPYNILNNSCTTTCIVVLKAAGLKPPWWARTPHLLDLWFRSIGVKNVPIPGVYEGGRQ